MLRNLLQLLTTPIAKPKSSRTIPTTTPSYSRPLSLQTIYPGNKPAPYQTVLTNQYKISETLLSRPDFKDASIELCQLDKSFSLIGLTRHLKTETILGCIFMYPESIRYSEDWQLLFEKADQQQTGIAIFQPTRLIDCFRIILDAKIQPSTYLIHNRDVHPREWLLQPRKA